MRRICSIGAILILILVTFTGIIFAEKIDLSIAQQVGTVQLQVRKQIGLAQALSPAEYYIQTVRLLEDTDTGEALAYILDLQPKGFVAISSDTDIRPIIAYSYYSNFSMEDLEHNVLLYMLKQDMRNRLNAISLTSQTMKTINNQLWEKYLSEEKSRALVSELADADQWPDDDTGWLDTTWHQTDFYNDSCPNDPNTLWRCVVGCTAVAMGQVIYYWQYPDSISFDSSDRYVSRIDPDDGNGERVIHIDEDHETLDFPSFDELNTRLANISYSGDKQEIADFLFACGISVKMDYSDEGSGAWIYYPPGDVDAERALKNKFGYQANGKYESDGDFYDVLENNMKGGQPALLSISKDNGGHAIVADGFRSTDEYHLNFGWGSGHPDSISEAWYSLPKGMPAGFTIVSRGVTDIHPNTPPNTPLAPTGPNSGTPGTSYDFTATTTDPDGDDVAFKFDWGDGNESDWTGFVDSGASASASHSWVSDGTYEVKAKAKDTQGAESGWSETHQIVISRPDLTINSISPDAAQVDEEINVIVTVANQGTQDVTKDFWVDIYYDPSAPPDKGGYGDEWQQITQTVQAGESIQVTFTHIFNSSGDHEVWAQVDTSDFVSETDENNNIYGPHTVAVSERRHENESFSLPAEKWKMISIPFTLDDASPNTVLVDDLGEQNDTVWKLYRWNTTNGSYDKYPYVGNFSPGKAFWIISKDVKTIDTGPGTDVTRQTDFVISLPSGWSQIGNPFPFSVSWNEVRVRRNAEVVSILEAQTRGWVRDKIWYWDGQSYLVYQAPSGTIDPYEGYWAKALFDCELLLPPDEAQGAKVSGQTVESKEEFLQLKAKVGELEDNYNFLGFSEAAKDTYDRLDVEEPPPISSYISLFFPHPEWGKNKGDYTQDIRAGISQTGLKQVWDFQVKTDQINQKIIVEWENTSAFPEDIHLYLTDSFWNVLANMREECFYGFASTSSLESFKIIATSEALPLPEDLDLIEVYSYPNPAHGKGVQFHFYLASPAKVSIKIYSISGELVKTLINEKACVAGAYEEFWKEHNDRGEKLARGVYIYIIQAGNSAKVVSKSGKIGLLD